MKSLSVVALALLCTFGSAVSLFAYQAHHHRPRSHSQRPPSQQATAPQEFVDAIIREINYAEGLLIVETATEILHVRLAPEEAREFHVGEKIQVQLLSADTIGT